MSHLIEHRKIRKNSIQNCPLPTCNTAASHHTQRHQPTFYLISNDERTKNNKISNEPIRSGFCAVYLIPIFDLSHVLFSAVAVVRDITIILATHHIEPSSFY